MVFNKNTTCIPQFLFATDRRKIEGAIKTLSDKQIERQYVNIKPPQLEK